MSKNNVCASTTNEAINACFPLSICVYRRNVQDIAPNSALLKNMTHKLKETMKNLGK